MIAMPETVGQPSWSVRLFPSVFLAGIEDTHVFPFLARKMDVLSLQHDHEEMERIIDSIKASCRAGVL